MAKRIIKILLGLMIAGFIYGQFFVGNFMTLKEMIILAMNLLIGSITAFFIARRKNLDIFICTGLGFLFGIFIIPVILFWKSKEKLVIREDDLKNHWSFKIHSLWVRILGIIFLEIAILILIGIVFVNIINKNSDRKELVLDNILTVENISNKNTSNINIINEIVGYKLDYLNQYLKLRGRQNYTEFCFDNDIYVNFMPCYFKIWGDIVLSQNLYSPQDDIYIGIYRLDSFGILKGACTKQEFYDFLQDINNFKLSLQESDIEKLPIVFRPPHMAYTQIPSSIKFIKNNKGQNIGIENYFLTGQEWPGYFGYRITGVIGENLLINLTINLYETLNFEDFVIKNNSYLINDVGRNDPNRFEMIKKIADKYIETELDKNINMEKLKTEIKNLFYSFKTIE